MPAQDSSIILERSLAEKNVKIKGETASADQEAAHEFPDAITKIIDEKGYLPVQVFKADKSALLWKKWPQKIFISKEEEWAPKFNAGRDGLTVVLCKCSQVYDQDCSYL